jgi:hypothetical protein
MLDVAVEDGDVAAEAHRADSGLVQQLEELILQLGNDRILIARPDGTSDGLLGQVHRVVGRPTDPNADDPGRTGLAAGADDRLEDELLDPLHAVGRDAHLQEAHVLRAGALGNALDVEAVPVRHELPVDDRQPVAGVRPGVLARDRVHRVRAQRMLDRRTLGPGFQRLVDPRRVEREMLADPAGVDGDARVLADEVLLAVGDLHVLEDRREHTLPGDGGLPPGRICERVAQVLRDVLQRPDVEVGGRVLDGPLEIGVDRSRDASGVTTSPRTNLDSSAISFVLGFVSQLLLLSAAAIPALRPKTQHSSSELPIIRFRPCVPPAISPHANIPSSVVSPAVSITSPPFW